jgi:hypothetical protein
MHGGFPPPMMPFMPAPPGMAGYGGAMPYMGMPGAMMPPPMLPPSQPVDTADHGFVFCRRSVLSRLTLLHACVCLQA